MLPYSPALRLWAADEEVRYYANIKTKSLGKRTMLVSDSVSPADPVSVMPLVEEAKTKNQGGGSNANEENRVGHATIAGDECAAKNAGTSSGKN